MKKITVFKNFRDFLALALLMVFFAWLALVAFWFVPKITAESLDPMMALIAGLGIGGVTNALLVLITLVIQFYFRKASTEEIETPKPPS